MFPTATTFSQITFQGKPNPVVQGPMAFFRKIFEANVEQLRVKLSDKSGNSRGASGNFHSDTPLLNEYIQEATDKELQLYHQFLKRQRAKAEQKDGDKVALALVNDLLARFDYLFSVLPDHISTSA